jgi:hypothetical protein
MSFNAGGTVIESPRFPPVGVENVFGIPGLQTRTVGLGTWSYSPRRNRYTMTLRYDFFVDGQFYGTGTVDRDLQLNANGNSATGSVTATIRGANGAVLRMLCGSAVSTRL